MICKSKKLWHFSVLALALFPHLVLAAPLTPFTREVNRNSTVVTDVNYYGGPVISHVKVHIVYWGTGVEAGLKTQLSAFYQSIVNSDYLDQLAEYGTKTQTIGRGSLGQSIVIAPVNHSKNLSQANIEDELDAQIGAGKIPKPDANSLYMIHFPDGYSIRISFGESCSSWFADHEVYQSKKFGNIFYAMFPCESASMSGFSTLTVGASHELAEAITDPLAPLANQTPAFPAAWLTGSADEIGDLCAWDSSTLSAGNQSFSVQSEWLNSKHGCNRGHFSGN